MEPAITPTIKSTNPRLNNEPPVLNGILPAENLQRKAKFRKVMAKMWTISSRYLKVVLTSGPICELLAPVQTERRAIGQNESHSRCGEWVCRKYSGTNV